jgi:hypothetical protein
LSVILLISTRLHELHTKTPNYSLFFCFFCFPSIDTVPKTTQSVLGCGFKGPVSLRATPPATGTVNSYHVLSSERNGDKRSSYLGRHRFIFQLKKLLADRLLVVYLMGVLFAPHRIIKDYFYCRRSSNSDKENQQE